jgi:hypothetical protein
MAVTSVAMIIDYGDSYVEVDGVGYGTFRVEMGTFPRFNQFTDAFRFLSNVLHQLMSLPPSNYLNQVTALVKKIWNQFFSTDSIRSTFEELIENDTYFIIQTPPIDYPSFSDFIDKVERILDVKYHLPLRPTDALPLIPMSYHDVLSEEGIVHHQYPNNIVDGYYTIKSIDEAISHLNDNPTKRDKLTKTRNDFLAYLRGLPSYHDQLETLIKSIMTQIDNHTVISTMEMYPPLNIGDPRAYSYVINYIKLLIRTNIAATKLKYIALFDRDNYDRLTNLNLTNWNVIESNPPLEKLMKKLRLYHIRSQNVPNDHRLSPSSTELTTLEDQHTYSHQIPEWFDKNYYRLKDIIPAHLFR